MALNPKRQRFVREYLIDLNATQAAIRAGYSPKTAYSCGNRLLSFDEVSEAIDTEIAESLKGIELTGEVVRDGLLREANFRGEGSTHSARVAAWRALGEYLKLFVQKHEHTGEIVHVIENMSAEERNQRASSLVQKAALLPRSANAA